MVTSPTIHSIVLTTRADVKVLTTAGKTRAELFRMSSDDDPCGRGTVWLRGSWGG